MCLESTLPAAKAFPVGTGSLNSDDDDGGDDDDGDEDDGDDGDDDADDAAAADDDVDNDGDDDDDGNAEEDDEDAGDSGDMEDGLSVGADSSSARSPGMCLGTTSTAMTARWLLRMLGNTRREASFQLSQFNRTLYGLSCTSILNSSLDSHASLAVHVRTTLTNRACPASISSQLWGLLKE